MLHLDARSRAAPARPTDLFVQPHQTLKGNGCKEADNRGESPLRQSPAHPKSMLSVLPLSNDIVIEQSPGGALSERKPELITLHGCPPPPLLPTVTSKANAAELRSLPKVLVSWSSRDILPSSTSTSSARLPDPRGLSSRDLCKSRILGVENGGHPCRESGSSRSMNGPEKPTVTATANGGMGAEGRAWLSDVTTVVTAAAANNNNAAASNPHHATSSPSLTGQRLHEASTLLPVPGSLFRPPISLSSSPDYSNNSQSHLYSQYPALHGSPSYYPPPSGSHGQQLFSASHLPPSLSAYSYYPLQFSPRTYAAPPPASMMARPFPQMESYAHPSVMGTMGSHPRSAFLPSQYSATLNPSSTSPNQTSSFSVVPRTLNPSVSFAQPGHVQFSTSVDPETHSPNKDGRHKTSSTSSLSPLANRHLPTSKNSSSSSPTAPTSAASLQQTMISVDNKIAQPKDLSQHNRDLSVREHLSYRLPSGKEGSLKHRILTRPPDIHIEHSALLAERSPDVCASPKHSKSKTVSPLVTSASMPTTPVRASTSAWRGSPPLPMSACNPLCYPAHFVKGSIIQLANGEFRSVEELRTEDFVQSAEMSADLKINSSTVVRIEEHVDAKTCTLGFSVGEQRVQVNVEAALEHPFFVFGQGWSSCLPDRTQQRYNLQCKKLQVGDVCISLTLRDQPSMRSAALTSCSSVAPPPMDVSGRLLSLSRRTEFMAPGATAATPLTHNIETQTPAGNTMPSPRATLPSVLPSTLSAGQPCAPRKRRWSAPDKMNEESKTRTKLS